MTGLLEGYNVSLNGERQRFQTVLHCHVVAPRPGRLLCMCDHVVKDACGLRGRLVAQAPSCLVRGQWKE